MVPLLLEHVVFNSELLESEGLGLGLKGGGM